MSKPTIKDVAKLAGVSISTVSRVINDSKPVSPEARRKVVDAIEKLDFKPNEVARSLVMKRSNLIGVVVKDIGISYMAQIVRGVEEIGQMYKYDIMLSSTYGDLKTEKEVIDFLMTKQVEGIIVITENTNAEVLYQLKSSKTPFIQLDKFYGFDDIHTVKIDYRQAMAQLVDEAVAQGHRKLALVTGGAEALIYQDKRAGFEARAQELGLDYQLIQATGPGVDQGYELGPEIIEKKDAYSLVMFSEDEQAIGFSNYCYDQGIALPETLSITGFGDIPMARYLRPTLTTVREPYYDIGAVSMRMLVKVLREGFTMTEDVLLPSQVLARGSVKKLDDQ